LLSEVRDSLKQNPAAVVLFGHVQEYYRAHSGVPVDAALDEGGRMHVLVCDEHVAAAVHVSAKGRLSVFFAENYMDNATFDAAIAEGLRMVREDGRIGAWTRLPSDEACYVGKFLQNGFFGVDEGKTLMLTRDMRNTTE
ncbi:MAG: hypothetical protein RSA70_04375, partial [Clostridia bacterium]